MDIKYELVPPGNHIPKNAERSINTFKNHFIEGIFSVDIELHLKLCYRMTQQATISLNML